MFFRKLISILLLSLFCAFPAWAIGPDEILEDPALEERARELSAGLRCMVCQNQSIDDSDAPLAKDLRVLVRERLVAGDSNTEVIDYLVSRYGEFVLLKPRFAWHTLALWGAGPLALVLGGGAIFLAIRKRKSNSEYAANNGENMVLSQEEEQKLEALLKDGNQA